MKLLRSRSLLTLMIVASSEGGMEIEEISAKKPESIVRSTVEPAVGIYHSHHDAQIQIPDGMFGSFMVGEMPIPDVLKEKGYTIVPLRVFLNEKNRYRGFFPVTVGLAG